MQRKLYGVINDGSNYVVKRYKVSFQKCRDKCFERKQFTSGMTDN
jgi:hypothetical protein